MERCDYCASTPVVGHGVQERTWTWGRWTFTVQRIRVRLCINCLGEGGAPLSADEFRALRERLQDEDQ